MMDWLAKAMGLPEAYLSVEAHPEAKGGGVILVGLRTTQNHRAIVDANR